MEKREFFSYTWHIDENETDRTVIRIYGLDEKNQNICVRVENFTPYIYLELPDVIDWDVTKAQLVGNKIDSLLHDKKPISKQLMFKKRLYNANLDKNFKKRLFPYLFCNFATTGDIDNLCMRIRKPVYVIGLGTMPLRVHEREASPILQLTSLRKIPPSSWISFLGKKVKNEDKTTNCQDEYIVQWKNLFPKESNIVARPLIMGYDLEVNSSIPSAMPNASRPADKIFQVSCVFARQGSKENTYEKYLLTLVANLNSKPNQAITGEDVKILCFTTEYDLLLGFTNLMQEKQPNIIVGYNIFDFDIPYMIERSRLLNCFDFDRQGLNKFGRAKERLIKWSSSAYKNQSFRFLEAEGRIFVDLLPLVKRDYKMNNYKLKTISAHFLKGQTKDPLDHIGIFKCYRLGMKGDVQGNKALAVVGKYCIQDSLLVVKLFEVLTTWVGLCEMSKVTNVPIFSLYTQGQQLKVYSQVYRKTTHENYVVEKDGYIPKDDEHYVGATVFPPIPGLYDKVIPFDFTSLYPTTIIAYNISWDTLVTDDTIPDDLCHVMIWDDHIGCEHDPKEIRKFQINKLIKEADEKLKEMRRQRDLKSNKHLKEDIKLDIEKHIDDIKPLREERSILQKSKPKHIMCGTRKYRWLKSPMGVLPEILTNLLTSRDATKKEMKAVKNSLKEIKDETKREEIQTYIEVLDKKQLALKISANSAYGALGVRRGYLPFMPGAMCTTYKGRVAVQLAANSIKDEHGGKLIYGDSVSADTPIFIRYNNISINLVRIDSLVKSDQYIPYNEFKAEDSNRKEKEQCLLASHLSCEVWTNNKWSKIRRVIRHKTNKVMFRILTHTGCVDVTEDHSLLTENLEKVKPTEVYIGTKLLHSFPKFEEYNQTIFNTINLSKEEAFVWGFFMANGSCSIDKNDIYSWIINNANLEYLERTKKYLEQIEPDFQFKILNLKQIVTVGNIQYIVCKYQNLLYNEYQEKIVPYSILNSDIQIKRWFFEGYYSNRINYNKNDIVSIDCKGKIGAQGLYILLKSIGYDNVSINTRENKPNIFRINGSFGKIRKDPIAIKKIIQLPDITDNEFVYDLETDEGVFHAGIGEIVVKNTDSNYVSFPQLNTAQECWDHAINVAKKVSSKFPKPMSLAFEETIYWKYFIIAKKKYMSLACERDGVLSNNISKKGVLLQRRDNCPFIRKVYEHVIMSIFNKENRDDILYYIIEEINKLCSHFYPVSDFIITKAIGDFGDLNPKPSVNDKGKPCYKVGDYTVKILPDDKNKKQKQMELKGCSTEKEYYLKCMQAHVQLAEKMRQRGQLVPVGTRLEYVITTEGGHNANQYDKVESAEYFSKHGSVLKIDYMTYLKQLVNPLDQVLNIMYGENSDYTKDFVRLQYKYRLRIREKVLDKIRTIFAPKLEFE